MYQPLRMSLLQDVWKYLRKTLSPDIGGFAASSELRLQDVLPDQRSRRAAGDVETHGLPEGSGFPPLTPCER